MNKRFLMFCSMDGIRQRYIISPYTCRPDSVWMSLCSINFGCRLIQKLLLCYYSYFVWQQKSWRRKYLLLCSSNISPAEEHLSCFVYHMEHTRTVFLLHWPNWRDAGFHLEFYTLLHTAHNLAQGTIYAFDGNRSRYTVYVVLHKWTFYSRIHLPKCS